MGWIRYSTFSLHTLLRWGPPALMAVACVLYWIGARASLERSIESQFEQSCKDRITLLASMARDRVRQGMPMTADLLREWSRKTNLEIHWVDSLGTVTASFSEEAGTGPVADRPEILQARVRGLGMARTEGTGKDPDKLHVAQLVRHDESLGILRGSASLEPVRQALRRLNTISAALAAILIVLAGAFGLLLTRRVLHPLSEVRAVVKDASVSDLNWRPALRSGSVVREIGELSDSVNLLCQAFSSRLKTLARSEAQLQAVLASTQEGMLILSPGFRVLYANPAARALLGQADRPPPAGRIFEWIRSPELEEILSSRGESDEPAEREIQLFGDPGERVLLATMMSFRRPGSERNEHLLILRDVTESRRLEQMRREFVANVSHELRTPLTSIRGFVETLLAGGLEDKEHNVRFVKKIKSQAARLELLVNELLDLSRLETARQKLDMQDMDCGEIVQDVVREFDESLASAGLTWKIDIPSRPILIRGDRKALFRALSNLVDNAVKHSKEGDEIRVSVYRKGEQGCVSVEDTGPGIPEDEKARIFERFYRGSSSRSTRVPGSGLGLSIVKHLVQALEGQLSVDTQLGKGSRFTISFPLST